jgi:uncharacterized SAM-binding protein YcdF (DUF218 family)
LDSNSVQISVIWYGIEILATGELGPYAIRRLDKAMKVAIATSGTIVLSTGFKPGHTAQQIPTRDLARVWLKQQGFERVHCIEDHRYSTEGELNSGASVGSPREIHVSSWWHIPRIKILRKRRGIDAVQVEYARVWDFPRKSVFQELLKLIAIRFPDNVQRRLKSAAKKAWGDTQQ